MELWYFTEEITEHLYTIYQHRMMGMPSHATQLASSAPSEASGSGNGFFSVVHPSANLE